MSNSWVLDYMNLIDPISQSPATFNLWSAMSVVSGTLKRNVWINYGTYQIFPNMFLVLVAPPGVGKGEAMTPAHSFPRERGLINYFNDRATAPKIVEKLSVGFTPIPTLNGNGHIIINKDTSACVFAPEFHSFLGASDWMFSFLCQVWDQGTYEYSTKKDDTIRVKDMCISLITACIPEYITRLSKDSATVISSGFSARTLFLKADKPSKKIAWDAGFRLDPRLAKPIADLEDRLALIATFKGEVEVTPQAKANFANWYNNILNIADEDSLAVRNFKSRQHVHVLKAAMTIAASLGTKSPLVIDERIMAQAISMIEDIAIGVDDVFRGVGESDVSEGMGRLQLYFLKKNQATYGEILRDNVRIINEENIIRVLRILEYTGFIRVSNKNGEACYSYSGLPVPQPKPFSLKGIL